jgi:hypothetical protein
MHFPDDLLNRFVIDGTIENFPNPEPGFGDSISGVPKHISEFVF